MSRTMIATDLDRTVIYSPSALMLADTPETVQRLVCVEVYKGRPLSFVTENAATMLADLFRSGLLVPTTTRTVQQFRRIALPGPSPTFALCANGARLLHDGVEDIDFTAAVTARLQACGAPLDEMLTELTRVSAGEGRHFVDKIRDASGVFCYAVVDRKRLPQGWVEHLSGYAAERSWSVSVQGGKVYLVPAALSKATAAREVADRLGADRLLAAGDSLLDGELLESVDAAIRPAHGELADIDWQCDHLTVTESVGVLAGEEIVSWMTQHTLHV